MLAAQPALRRVVKVDAAVGRQAPDILDRIRSYRSAGDLPAAASPCSSARTGRSRTPT